MTDLTPMQRSILAVEAAWPQHSGAKDHVIAEKIGVSSARYYQLLNRLVRDKAAVAHDPILTARVLAVSAASLRILRKPADTQVRHPVAS